MKVLSRNEKREFLSFFQIEFFFLQYFIKKI